MQYSGWFSKVPFSSPLISSPDNLLRLSHLTAQLKAAETNLAEKTRQMGDAQALAAQYKEAVESKEAEIQRLKQQGSSLFCDAFKHQITTLQNELKTDRGDLKSALAAVKTCETDVKTCQEELKNQDCEEKLHQLSNALEDEKKSSAHADDEIARLQSELLSANREADTINNKLSDADDRLQQQQQQCENAQAELNAKLKKAQDQQRGLSESFDEALTLCEQVEAERASLAGLHF